MSSSSTSSSSSENEVDFIMRDFIMEPSTVQRRLELIAELFRRQTKTQRASHRRTYINRDRENGHDRLYMDYFSDNPMYSDAQFRRRFRMRKHVFLRIVEALKNHYPYFQQRVDATGRRSLSPLQKCTAAMHMLAYGMSASTIDDYVQLGESTATECLKKFVKCVISVFGEEYLRRPNANDIQRLLHFGEKRGFPGMLGSIDCMCWEWKNCPTTWKRRFAQGDHREPTIILEAVASHDLWIWHAFFGVPDTQNNIYVLDQSPAFNDILEGQAPLIQFMINGREYNTGYYLTDGIYPPSTTFIQSIRFQHSAKARLFSQHQEMARKDVEHAFRVLQARFAIIQGPSRMWDIRTVGEIMRACIILHNMIIEDERDRYALAHDISQHYQAEIEEDILTWEYSTEHVAEYETYIQNRVQLRDKQTHEKLQLDLVENIWNRFGPSNT